MDKYRLRSAEICGLYPEKKVYAATSSKVAILRQAANRIVLGKTTFISELLYINYMLCRHGRMQHPLSKHSLIYMLRRLVKKADVDNKYFYLHTRKKHDHGLEKTMCHADKEGTVAILIRQRRQRRLDAEQLKIQKQAKEHWVSLTQDENQFDKYETLAQDQALTQYRQINHLLEPWLLPRCISPVTDVGNCNFNSTSTAKSKTPGKSTAKSKTPGKSKNPGKAKPQKNQNLIPEFDLPTDFQVQLPRCLSPTQLPDIELNTLYLEDTLTFQDMLMGDSPH